MKKLLSIFILILVVLQLFAGDDAQVIDKANKAYSDGHYADAIELYEQLINNGLESSELYYNLGNSYFKINDLPSAILYYEKAIKLDPADEDVTFNLKVANSMIPDKIEEVPVMFYKRWWNSIYDLFGANTWAKLSVICLIAFLIMLAIYFAGNSYFIKKTFFWFALIFFVFTIFSFSFSFQKYNTSVDTKEAIVFDPTITVKSSPDEGSIDLFVIHEGTKLTIIEHIGDWYEIRIANGSVGWLPVSSIKPI